jgi:cytochrome P450
MRRLNMSVKPRVQQIVDDLLDMCIKKNEIDMVSDFTAPLVRTVACEIVGVPVSDYPTYRHWSAAIVRGVDPDSLLAQHEVVARYAAEDSFMEYFTPIVNARRASPRDDLLSDIIALEKDGQGISEEELLKIFAMLMIATHETTVNALGNMMISLCRHADQRELVRRDQSLVVPAVEECLRFDPPVQFTSRVALKEAELGGQNFAPGDGVVVLIASANHDDAVYENSDTLDVTRFHDEKSAERHIAFSLGHHFCLGAPLARIELETALRKLLQRAPGYAMLNEEVSYRKIHTFRGPETLPVRLRP